MVVKLHPHLFQLRFWSHFKLERNFAIAVNVSVIFAQHTVAYVIRIALVIVAGIAIAFVIWLVGLRSHIAALVGRWIFFVGSESQAFVQKHGDSAVGSNKFAGEDISEVFGELEWINYIYFSSYQIRLLEVSIVFDSYRSNGKLNLPVLSASFPK